MIAYFSGTGNSALAAKWLAEKLQDKRINLAKCIKGQTPMPEMDERPLVVVTPIYGWRVPRLVQAYLEQHCAAAGRPVYFVMTCGDSAGNAAQYAKALCEKIQGQWRGLAAVKMPENYLAMFAVPGPKEAEEILKRARPAVDELAGKIKAGEMIEAAKPGPIGRLESGIVNDVFYKCFVKAKKFWTTQACIGYGLCAQRCPLNNIAMQNGRPQWGTACTHCMACIAGCPKTAVEYGKKSKGKPRYFNREGMED